MKKRIGTSIFALKKGAKKTCVVAVFIAICCLVFSVQNKAHAVSIGLTNTSIDKATYSGLIGNTLASMESAFFFPEQTGDLGPIEGKVVSKVFQGIGDAAGMNVFVYQVQTDSPGSYVFDVNDLRFDFFGLMGIDIGNDGGVLDNSFVLSEAVDPLTDSFNFSGSGSIGLTGASIDGSSLAFEFATGLNGGIDSYVFGIFSSNPFTIITPDFNAPNGGSTGGIILPDVYTAAAAAVPEPSTFLLLALPLAIILGFKLRRGGFKCAK